MNNNLITFLNPLIAIDKKHDSPTLLSLAITKQIKDEQHRCLLYNNHTDEQYRKNVTEIEEKPHYQVGLCVFSLLPLCESAFYMSQGLCHGSAVGRTVSLVLSWEAVHLAFMLCETPSPLHLQWNFPLQTH